jgi:tetratricopeptide (TPR) repeat protein
MNPKFQAALALHQRGVLDRAAVLYQEVLQSEPGHVDSLHLLGVVASQLGNHVVAVDFIGRAIKRQPDNPHFHFNLGVSQEELGQLWEAMDSFSLAISLDGGNADAYLNLGNCFYRLGEALDAADAFRQAILIRPTYAAAYSNLGNALQDLARWDESVESHRRAVEIAPEVALFHFNLGNVLKAIHQYPAALERYENALRLQPDHAGAIGNQGGVLMQLERFDEALMSFERLIVLQPNDATAHSNLGNALVAQKRFTEAIRRFEDAIKIAPADPQIFMNWANALIGIGDIKEAVECLNQAISIDPEYAEAYSNMGSTLKALGQFASAIKLYDRATHLDPDLAEAHWNKGLTELLLGDFEAGWSLYEWRWKTREYLKHSPTFAQPLWLGQEEFGGVEGLSGKTILVHSEQGFGDTIQFARYLPLLAELGARVVFELPEVLLGTLQGIPGVDAFVVQGQALPPLLPAADFHCPLLSLPLAFKTTLESIPTPGPYLKADAQKVEQWSVRLGSKSRPRIGLVWSGNSKHKNDHNRSLSLELLLSELPERFDWVSLQREVREADQQVLELRPSVRHFGAELKDFTDTAALCALMDLVISVDTSVAHLSGALGRPTWVLLPNVPDWRWLLDRDDSPWYSCLKLYRQPAPGEWVSVFQRLSNDLLKFDQL